MKKRKTPNT